MLSNVPYQCHGKGDATLGGIMLDKEAFLGFVLEFVGTLHKDGGELVRPDQKKDVKDKEGKYA